MINLAVIGCGYWGVNYVRLLHEIPRARLVCVCDSRPERMALMRQKFPLLSVTNSLDEVFDNRWVDAVVIATPAATHHALAVRALRSGKHVMVEKPMATSVEEAEEMAAAAADNNRVLMVGLTFLYNAGIRKLREMVSDPEFGTVYYLHCTRTNMGPVRHDVSAIWDLASHDLAICDYLLDQTPVWVQAQASTVLDHDLADIAFLTLGYPGNILANIHVSWVDPNKVREVVVVGSQRRVLLNDLNAGEPVRVFEKGICSTRIEPDSFGEFRLQVRDGDIISPRIAPSEPLRNQMEHFLDCILTDRPPISDGAVGLANVRALSAVEESLAKRGAQVEVSGYVSSHSPR
jgi:predicted dehydrogenase